MNRPLNADDVMRDLRTRCIGRVVRCHDAIDSTNEAAFRAAAEGAPTGTVVTAETQTRGRGRLGRVWHSPRGGLWCSVLLRPPGPPGDRAFLTVLGALGMARAIEAVTSCHARIRWPNDVLIGERKVAGVLVEVRDGAGCDGAAVIGLGCNVGALPSDLPPDVAAASTALETAAGRAVDRGALLRALCRALDDGYARLCAGDTAALDAEWQDRSAVLGAAVRLTTAEGTAHGRVVAIGTTTGVTLADPDGRTRHFRGEHITRLEMA